MESALVNNTKKKNNNNNQAWYNKEGAAGRAAEGQSLGGYPHGLPCSPLKRDDQTPYTWRHLCILVRLLPNVTTDCYHEYTNSF